MKETIYNGEEIKAIFSLIILLIVPLLAFGINDIIDGIATFFMILFGVLLFGVLFKAIRFKETKSLGG